MINHFGDFENPLNEKECVFGNTIRELKICALLKKSNIRKNRGKSVYEIFQFLLLLVFQKNNLFRFLNSKKKDTAFSKNTYYRFLNECHYNWQRFMLLLSTKVVSFFSKLTDPKRKKVFILDDSVIPHQRSKRTELLSWVHDHVINKTVKGFNLLALNWSDGYSTVPVMFNMMASAKKDKRINEADPRIDKRTRGYKCRKEAVMRKPEASIEMIKKALDAGINASYVLVDTWFTNEPFIKSVTETGLDVIGMLKDIGQRYHFNGKLYTIKQIAKLIHINRNGNIFASVPVRTGKHGIPVRIIFVRNRNKRSEYITILTTDTSISDAEAVRIYGNRWSIELFFKVSKSLLRLGSEFHGLSYDMIVSSTTIVCTRFIILEWIRRKQNDWRTSGELFFYICDEVQDMELSTSIKHLSGIFLECINNGSININDGARCQLLNWFISQPKFIQALFSSFSEVLFQNMPEEAVVLDACQYQKKSA